MARLVVVVVVVEIRHKASKAGQSMASDGENLWQFMAADAGGSLQQSELMKFRLMYRFTALLGESVTAVAMNTMRCLSVCVSIYLLYSVLRPSEGVTTIQ